MEFRIADTFTDSLARLAGDEQKAVKTTAFDLQLNPAQPAHVAVRCQVPPPVDEPLGIHRVIWAAFHPQFLAGGGRRPVKQLSHERFFRQLTGVCKPAIINDFPP